MDSYFLFIPSWKKIHMLALTNRSDIQNLEISFSWDTAIHPSQLVLPTFSANFRKRTWNISQGKHTLYEPIQEYADLPVDTTEPPIHESYTISDYTQFSNVVSGIKNVHSLGKVL
jgi:hypothetical protein